MSLSQTKKQKEEFIGTENNRPGEAERRLKNQARNEEKTLEGRKLLKISENVTIHVIVQAQASYCLASFLVLLSLYLCGNRP